MHTLQGQLYFAAANTHFAGTALLCSSKYTFCRDSFTLQLQIHTLQDSFTFQLQMHTLQDSFILQLQKGGGSFAAAKSTFDQQTRLPHIFAATGTCSCKKCDFGSGTTGHCFSSKTCSKFAAVKARGLRSLHSAICVCRIWLPPTSATAKVKLSVQITYLHLQTNLQQLQYILQWQKYLPRQILNYGSNHQWE